MVGDSLVLALAVTTLLHVVRAKGVDDGTSPCLLSGISRMQVAVPGFHILLAWGITIARE